MQIPIATSNGQTIIQTVHIPIQTVATAMPNTGGLIQAGGQLQIIQPQLTQVKRNNFFKLSKSNHQIFYGTLCFAQLPQQQLAQVITPSGQIQLAQIQPAQAAATQGLTNFTQNANGTITIQVQTSSQNT